MMEGRPKTKLETIIEEMKLKGFTYYRTDGLYETRGVSSKNNNNEGFMFKTEQFQTKEDIVNKYKNAPEFSEVKDSLEIELVEGENETYFVFIKIN
ncbi:MAG: hypothetical protein WCI91_02980 [Candidatus Nomurabacteria bacterium]